MDLRDASATKNAGPGARPDCCPREPSPDRPAAAAAAADRCPDHPAQAAAAGN